MNFFYSLEKREGERKLFLKKMHNLTITTRIRKEKDHGGGKYFVKILRGTRCEKVQHIYLEKCDILVWQHNRFRVFFYRFYPLQ